MQTRAQKCENGYTICIPAELAEEAGIGDGTVVDISEAFGGVIVFADDRRPPTPEEQLARITDENLHDPVDEGPPVGKEFL